MLSWWRRWRESRILARNPIDERDWQTVVAQLPLLKGLSSQELAKLRRMSVLFIQEKSFVGVDGIQVTGNMALLIALQACLPILHLGLEWYRGWRTILIYPAAFKTRRTRIDEYGIEHHSENHLAGEAWSHGGVILAWDQSATAGLIDGHNLVIHEFVHKLDMINGNADGFPPLHANMSASSWTQHLTAAYEHFCERIRSGAPTPIDTYGATNPAEFIAVTSEVFFELPDVLYAEYPEVYQEYCAFYRQNPKARLRVSL